MSTDSKEPITSQPRVRLQVAVLPYTYYLPIFGFRVKNIGHFSNGSGWQQERLKS